MTEFINARTGRKVEAVEGSARCDGLHASPSWVARLADTETSEPDEAPAVDVDGGQ